MAVRVCVGNRQGGVGKSTITMMLAHALACVAKKRVLVIDLEVRMRLATLARPIDDLEVTELLEGVLDRPLIGRALQGRNDLPGRPLVAQDGGLVVLGPLDLEAVDVLQLELLERADELLGPRLARAHVQSSQENRQHTERDEDAVLLHGHL